MVKRKIEDIRPFNGRIVGFQIAQRIGKVLFHYKRIHSDCLIKTGKDGKTRSSNYEVAVILFSEAEIYCFKRQFSLINPEHNIETDEYHYSDIVSLSTKTLDTHNKDDQFIQKGLSGQKALGGESFTILTSGGSTFTVFKVLSNLKKPENKQELKAFEESVQGMKQLWREKKIFS